jgi:peptide/nickel transport system substrate-binding protein
MKKLLTVLLCLMVLVIPSIFAAGQTEQAPAQTAEVDYSETGRLNVLWFAAGGTDGTFECVYRDYQSQIPDLLYDTLIKLDMQDNTKLVPRMADRWEVSADGLEYKFYIRENLNWSDGVPVTADDFVFSFEAQLRGYGIQNERGSFAYIVGAEEYFNNEADSITGIKADGKVLTITLKQPYGFMMRTLATFVPYPRHGFPEDVDYKRFGTYDYWKFPVHCGPYVLESVRFPDYCLLVRNEDWYGPRPGIKYVQGMSFETGGNDAAAAAMIAGRLDLVHSNAFNDINFAENVVRQNPDYAYNAFAAPYYRLFVTNLTSSADGKWNKFMADANFRKAINLALDKEGFASYFPGQAVALSTAVNPRDPFYDQSIPLFKRDVETAKKLLAQSGYDGSTVRIGYYYNDQIHHDLMELAAQNLREIGIKAEVQLYTQDLFSAIYERKNWDILYAGANQMSGIENYGVVVPGAVYDMYLGNTEILTDLFGRHMKAVLATNDPEELRQLGYTLQRNGLEFGSPIPVIAMDKIMVYNDAKWDFDPAWLEATDLAIYRTCDVHLETWKLLKP